MKFFYINNSQCTDCNRCSESCPTSAIYVAQDKRYINYDRCTSCGICMKLCTAGAVTLESLESMTIELERVELYKSRIQTLESELIQSRAAARDAERLLSDIVMRSPVAMFVADRNNHLIIANDALTELLAVDPLLLVQMPHNLSGESLSNIFSEQTIKLIRMSAAEQQGISNVEQIGERTVDISVSMLADGAILGFVRDLSDRAVVSDEIVARLRETIDRKMSMVQKIGFLLGEEVSVVVNNLNSVIRIIESSPAAKDEE